MAEPTAPYYTAVYSSARSRQPRRWTRFKPSRFTYLILKRMSALFGNLKPPLRVRLPVRTRPRVGVFMAKRTRELEILSVRRT